MAVEKSARKRGALPDSGLYALNAARFLSGEEPVEVIGTTTQPDNDPRFEEVEEAVHSVLRFPSGFTVTSGRVTGHTNRVFFRLQGLQGWAGMNPDSGITA